MAELSWIKELVRFEQDIEESGMIDFSAGFDPDRELIIQSIKYMNELKDLFVDAASGFNELKGGGLGGIKIYGISNTQADFMLFRNGYKLIFELDEPGKICIRSRHQGANVVPGVKAAPSQTDTYANEDEELFAQWGPFGEVKWTFKKQSINLEYLTRFYMSKFVRDSAR
ncbi:MAG: hypothetical protein AB8E15_10865 [Bdellovibrionales bacterium]